MACGTCKEKALRAERERIEREEAMRVKSSSRMSTDRNYARVQTIGCMVMNDELTLLERDVISLYKQTRTLEDNTIGFGFLSIQKKLRSWIMDLPNNCPPEGEYKEIRAKVLDGRIKYLGYNGDPERK